MALERINMTVFLLIFPLIFTHDLARGNDYSYPAGQAVQYSKGVESDNKTHAFQQRKEERMRSALPLYNNDYDADGIINRIDKDDDNDRIPDSDERFVEINVGHRQYFPYISQSAYYNALLNAVIQASSQEQEKATDGNEAQERP